MLNKAVELLRAGDVVAAPTETVYGLFADVTNDSAIQRIYQVKGRPSCNPLIIHVSGLEMARRIAIFSDEAMELVNYFWHVVRLPLTIVLPMGETHISRFATANLGTVAIRCPSHAMALDLIDSFGGPLAAPSANTSNSISPTTAAMVASDIGPKIPLILDGGPCTVGIESTILDTTVYPYIILRHGGVTQENLEEFLGQSIQDSLDDELYRTNKLIQESSGSGITIKAPGMMPRHYSPKLALRINAAYPIGNEAFIGFGENVLQCDINLSKTGDLAEAARNLYSALKTLDDPSKYTGIAVMSIPQQGLGIGINDRLLRASS